MSNPIPYTLTNESLTVVLAGQPKILPKGDVVFNQVVDALRAEKWDDVPGLLNPENALTKWMGDPWSARGRDVLYHGIAVPRQLAERIWASANVGENPTKYFNFWARLQKNPSHRSIEQLFPFLGHIGIPIEEDGTFLAYKGVTDDLLDVHSKTIDNSPGQVVIYDRNKVSDDPRTPCHEGLHVGALAYASSFGPRTIICRVKPENVVCIPYDHSSQKMRVCEYEVVGHHVEDHSEDNPLPESFEDDTVEPETCGDTECEDCYEDGIPRDPFDVTHEDADREAAAVKKWDISDVDRDGEPYQISEPEKVEKKRPRPATLGRLDAKGLMKVAVEDLRHYASKTLKIVGASKLTGGKTALVKRILRVRSKK